MNPFQILFFMVITLPWMMLQEAWHLFSKAMKEDNLWDKFLVFLVIFLSIILIALWLEGYR